MDIIGDPVAVQSQAQQREQQPKRAEYKNIFDNLMGDDAAAPSGNTQSGGGGDMLSANNAPFGPPLDSPAQQSTTSAFGFDIGGNSQQPQQTQQQAQNVQSSNGQSAFGFDLGGGGGGNVQSTATQQQQQQSQGQSANSSAFGFDLGGGGGSGVAQQQAQVQQQPMMTASMMQQKMQMRAQTMPMQQQPNLFQQTLAGVGGAQPQRAPQTYGHNDPFAQMMSGGGGQPAAAPVAANRPQKAGPDPFADLALGSMK